MAASHRLAIAKATFSAALLNQDEVCAPLSREDIVRFHSSLEATVQRCSPSNVERCKIWLSDYVLPSSARVTAFGKFLNTISASYGFEVQASKVVQTPTDKVPSCQRKRLHLLYLVNDLLHQTAFSNATARDDRPSFADSFRPTIVDLVKDAASFDQHTNRKHHERLNLLLQLWEEKAYFDSNFGADLASVMASEGKSVPSRARDGVGAKDKTENLSKKENWTLPSQHGETGTPWYDLPAACWLPSIETLMEYRERYPRRRRKGMDPRNIKPLRFHPGPVDPKLAKAVQQLIKDADSIYSFSLDDEQNIKSDYDRMGQKLLIKKTRKERDGQKVRLVTGDTYYGWTRDFAEKMYKARKLAREEASERARRKGSEPSERSDSSRSPSPEPTSLKRKWDGKDSSPPSRAPTGPRRNSLSSSSRPNSSDGRSYEPPQPQFNPAFPPPPPMQQPYQGYPTPPPPPGHGGYQAPPPPPPAGWQAPWPPAPPPPNYQQPQQYQQFQQYPAPTGYMQQQQASAGYMQQQPPPPFQGFQQPWMQQSPPPGVPQMPQMPQMPQFQQPYATPNQGQPAWNNTVPRGGGQHMGFRGRGRGGNRGGYGYSGRGY
ncbi:putative glutamate-tRNA ligase [Venturia nashicola]|uniref:Putative glutamate-tRNA ligase n=1 Tax=Venturia nashicola TaxID=86259 RepID=A0A4Z1P7W0_9PEZI|nr:putative glutamate-tRNA ligase [Venturia nashicola]TLD35727.1 putative glutamate-tRNA ligase [Venturia nashicola]